jgi:hypothetical protein
MAATEAERRSLAEGTTRTVLGAPAWLVSSRALTWREAALGLVAALALSAIVFGGHVLHGGFYLDDWTNWARWKYAPSFGEALRGLFDELPTSNHPLGPLVYAAGLELFGDHMRLHLASLAGLVAVASAGIYAALRSLGGSVAASTVGAALLLLWPWADAPKLWVGSGLIIAAFALFAVGLAAGVQGFTARTHRRRTAATAVSLLLYLLAVLVYELTAGAILTAVLAYLAVTRWRSALKRWSVDVVIAGMGLWVAASRNPVSAVQTPRGMVDHAQTIAGDALTLATYSVVPFGHPDRLVVLGGCLAVIGVGLVVRYRLAPDSPARSILTFGVVFVAVGAVMVVSGYAAIVPANDSYRPLDPGAGNRINTVAAAGFILVTLGLIVIVAGIASLRAPGRVAGGLALALAVVVGIGYWTKAADDAGAWDRGFAEEQRLIGVLNRSVPKPEAGSFIYLVGHQAQVAPGIPSFSWVWDLNGVVKLIWRDPSLGGLPVIPGTQFACTPDEIVPKLPGQDFNPYLGSPYKATFVDVSGRTARVTSQRKCRSVVRRFVGPDGLAQAPTP